MPVRQRSMTAKAFRLGEKTSDDELDIDFAHASLYLVGLQTVFSTVLCSVVSVACCWVLPTSMISAVRTLAMTSLAGFLTMKSALRVGRVRGVNALFSSLRPCPGLYILTLVVHQLVHTCVASTTEGGLWLSIVFHLMVVVCICSGFLRAYNPLSESDLPFLITCVCVFAVALLPPPAAVLAGPLCEPATLFGAAERIVRALFFSGLYTTHVYVAAPARYVASELGLCAMRATSASVWVAGAHVVLLPLAVVQAALALWTRFGMANAASPGGYNALDTASDAGLGDADVTLGGQTTVYGAPVAPADVQTLEDRVAEAQPLDAAGLAALTSGVRAARIERIPTTPAQFFTLHGAESNV